MAKPKHFNQLAKRYPEYLAAVEQLGESVKAAGPLEPKVAELIQLAAAAAADRRGEGRTEVSKLATVSGAGDNGRRGSLSRIVGLSRFDHGL